jgi:hypothetical protein
MSVVSALLSPENIVTDISESITEPHQCRGVWTKRGNAATMGKRQQG